MDSPVPLTRACHRGRRVVVTDSAPPVGTASHGRCAKGERALGSWLGSAGADEHGTSGAEETGIEACPRRSESSYG